MSFDFKTAETGALFIFSGKNIHEQEMEKLECFSVTTKSNPHIKECDFFGLTKPKHLFSKNSVIMFLKQVDGYETFIKAVFRREGKMVDEKMVDIMCFLYVENDQIYNFSFVKGSWIDRFFYKIFLPINAQDLRLDNKTT